jgi:hypothetical protein
MTDDERADDLKRALGNMPREIEEERRKSRYRDHHSRERVHEITHDFDALVAFIINKRKRVPGALRAARRVYVSPDPRDFRFLVRVVLDGGYCDDAMQRVCERIAGYCDILEPALAMLSAWKRERPS